MRWFGHLVRMLPSRPPGEVGVDPRVDPGHVIEILFLSWPGNTSVEELVEVAEQRCYRSLLVALLPDKFPDS